MRPAEAILPAMTEPNPAHNFLTLMPADEFRALLAAWPRLPAEEADLATAHGRFLADDLSAPEDLPPAARASMDGYAVRAADLFGTSESGPAYLEKAGSVAIHEPPTFALLPGQCAAITTGGWLPEGANAVAMVEHTHDLGAGTVEFRKPLAPNDNVLLRGEDATKGEIALRAGTLLRAPQIGLLAALGIRAARVGRLPRVAILSTGDELVPAHETPPPGRIRDVNAHALSAMVREAGALPSMLGIVPDETPALAKALGAALADHDVVLLSGGSSVGARDCTVAALDSLPQARVLVHGVAVSPGKPTILAEANGRAMFGLPGQVTSAQVVMHVFVLPFLRHLAGACDAFSRAAGRSAVLARNVASRHGREDWLRVALEEREGDLPLAHPRLGKSGLLRTLLDAQGLVRIPATREGLGQGARVEVHPF
ncbi:molybdenum cofactor synthesis domain containing protein [Alkalidesulfovibrio alkalitolerans DSM 16529]|jgi:molybdopterin molybdotransferase|uniref:Molybdopterin molybdenumtransferase n=2 Tax=Alkalidesulfovibrio alkalitolerans TaxID=293256 RepID=S7TCL5_9BACT|nr:molybdenum cofactor synthesis domain containing protein [Alkalidesulfovibrio alkalitolerans DSM 16529]